MNMPNLQREYPFVGDRERPHRDPDRDSEGCSSPGGHKERTKAFFQEHRPGVPASLVEPFLIGHHPAHS